LIAVPMTRTLPSHANTEIVARSLTAPAAFAPAPQAFLNGIRIPNMQSLRTLFAKIFGTIFAVAAGLPLGEPDRRWLKSS
jgi:hypothetical protein